MSESSSSQLPDPIVTPPDGAEMGLRIDRVRERMAAEDLDAYVDKVVHRTLQGFPPGGGD